MRAGRLIASREGQARCLQRMRPALGTLRTIEAKGHGRAAEQGIARAFQAIARVEMLMHPHRAGSDLVRLAGSNGRRLKIDPLTWQVLRQAQTLYIASDGCFDPCLPESDGTFAGVELLPDHYARSHEPVTIDLGGIAKGFAVDQAVDALRTSGCESGVVSAGGDLRVFGEQRQRIVVRLPHAELPLMLAGAAVAVSDADFTGHPAEYRGYYRRGAEHPLVKRCAAVQASTATVADALTKCVMLCDPPITRRLLTMFSARCLL